jgi:hypothetical protein
MWNIEPIQIQAILWKIGHAKGRSLMGEGEGKRRKLGKWIWLIYFLYKNEYRTFKPVEITIRNELRRKVENRGEELIQVIIYTYIEMSQWNSLHSYLIQTVFSQKWTGRLNSSCLGVGSGGSGEEVRKRCKRVNVLEILCTHVWKWENEICWHCLEMGEEEKENDGGVDSIMIHCKNFCKCHNVLPV